MQRYLKLRAGTKVLAIFVLESVLLVGIAAFAVSSLSGVRASNRVLHSVDFENALDVSIMAAAQEEVRGNLFKYLLMTDPVSKQVPRNEISVLEGQIDDIVTRLRERNKLDSSFMDRVDDWNNARIEFVRVREDKIMNMAGSGDIQNALRVALGEQADRMRTMEEQVERMVENTRSNVDSAVDGSDSRIRGVQLSFGVVMVIAVLLSAGGIALTNRAIRALRTVTAELKEGVEVLASSSGEITASTAQAASGAAETATAISQTSSTVEEVKQTATMVANKAKAVSEGAQRANAVSQQGNTAMQQVSDGMRSVRTQMDAIAESITSLSEQGQSIGAIIATVDDIAEQSNLLAVNAAIEAARAGANGAGFAVVAQEMRTLAEQSKDATGQVRQILNDIQRGVSQAGMATEQGAKFVDTGLNLSDVAAETIRSLLDTVTESAQAAVQISAASQQQLAGMDQVSQAMSNVGEASEQNAASTSQVEQSARDLNTLGQRLRALTEQHQF